jgi:hypothetical protein
MTQKHGERLVLGPIMDDSTRACQHGKFEARLLGAACGGNATHFKTTE